MLFSQLAEWFALLDGVVFFYPSVDRCYAYLLEKHTANPIQMEHSGIFDRVRSVNTRRPNRGCVVPGLAGKEFQQI